MAVSKMLLVCLMGLLAGSCLAQSCSDSTATHNGIRQMHGSKALTWDTALAAKATASAQELAKNGCKMRGGLGGNVWGCWGNKNCGTCSEAVTSWYEGGYPKYNFKSTKPWTEQQKTFVQWGTMTQVLWASASKVGCALVRGQNCAIVNCFYDVGNVVTDEQFRANVKDKVVDNTPSTDPGIITTTPLGDDLPDCAEWAASGYCMPAGPEYLFEQKGVSKSVAEWCPKSCATITTASKPAVKDMQRSCAAWAAKGYCSETGPEYLYKDPRTAIVNSITTWCPASCPPRPQVAIARRMMSGSRAQIFVPAAEEQAASAA